MKRNALILTIAIALIMAYGGSAFATAKNVDIYENIKQEIMMNVTEAYGENYAIEDVSWEITPTINTVNNKVSLDVSVTANVTLVQEPTSMPYYLGLKSAYDEAETPLEAETAQLLMDEYIEEVGGLYYNVPYETNFDFKVEVNNANISSRSGKKIDNILFIGYDGNSHSLDTLKIDDAESLENGKALAKAETELALQSNSSRTLALAASAYDRLGARDYALYHFYDHANEYTNNFYNVGWVKVLTRH